MEALKRLQDFIERLDTKEFYTYAAAFLGGLALIFSLLFFIHYRKISKYSAKVQELNIQRSKTKKILTEYKFVSQEKAHVDEVLAASKNFFIAQEYDTLLNNLNLKRYQPEEPTRSDGETISGKVERILKSRLDGISTKQLTDLLVALSDIERIYPKELIIKKLQNAPSIDVDLTIATLESTTETA